MNLNHAIQQRISIRKYSNKEIPREKLLWIKEQLSRSEALHPDIPTRFELLNDPEQIRTLKIGFLGGMAVVNAPCFIVAISKKNPGYLENIGFIQQQTVLALTEAGLDTCWLATFDKAKISEYYQLNTDETVVNLIAVGYRIEKTSFLNSGFRKMMGSPKRKDIREIAFFKNWGGDIHPYLEQSPEIHQILSWSILAPSAGNLQPVRVIVNEGKALFLAKRGAYGKLDAGIFLAHFFLGAVHSGLNIDFVDDSSLSPGLEIPDDYEYVISVKWDKRIKE